MTLISGINHTRSAIADFIRSRPFVTLCLVGGFVSFVGISNELWTPDEPRDAAIGRAMWESGDWIIPRLNGAPFLEKPLFIGGFNRFCSLHSIGPVQPWPACLLQRSVFSVCCSRMRLADAFLQRKPV